jgi:nitrate reductase cytochrome c-type subunit
MRDTTPDNGRRAASGIDRRLTARLVAAGTSAAGACAARMPGTRKALHCLILAWLLPPCLAAAGCSRVPGDGVLALLPTPTTVRAQRRAYEGAPPVIPHKPLGAACVTCHTETGKPVPELGLAPANPHQAPADRGRTQNCRQCHVFQRSTESFVANSFDGLRSASLRGERLYPGAPPLIPHSLQMRQSCNACHSGPAARSEIVCSHPQRANCRQCHLAKSAASLFPERR